MPESPIGVFDSGVGGLTVCKAIQNLLPDENIIYFGDTARFPYGTRSKETIIKYSREITDYLISRGVKMIVIACNTASAAAFETLKENYSVPIIGVIEAGARAACRNLSQNILGVIGTKATVNSASYVRAVNALRPDVEVFQRHATLFVSLAEEGMIDSEITRLAVKEYIHELYDIGVRRIILGCTHFPLLIKSINDVYPEIDLIDTGMEIALEVREKLREKNLENKSDSDNKGKVELYSSDITDTLQKLKEMFFGTNGKGFKKLVING